GGAREAGALGGEGRRPAGCAGVPEGLRGALREGVGRSKEAAREHRCGNEGEDLRGDRPAAEEDRGGSAAGGGEGAGEGPEDRRRFLGLEGGGKRHGRKKKQAAQGGHAAGRRRRESRAEEARRRLQGRRGEGGR